MRRIEAARLRQQAAVDAAAAKYLEEKKLVSGFGPDQLKRSLLLSWTNNRLLQKEEKAAKEKAEEWEKLQKGLGYHNKTKKPVRKENFKHLWQSLGLITPVNFLKESDDLTHMGLSNPNKTQSKSRLRDSGRKNLLQQFLLVQHKVIVSLMFSKITILWWAEEPAEHASGLRAEEAAVADEVNLVSIHRFVKNGASLCIT